jgi:MFS family permease
VFYLSAHYLRIMEFVLRNLRRSSPYRWLYGANLAVGFHYFSVQYVNSSFLTSFMSRDTMGLVFAGSSLLAFLALAYITRILSRIGTYRTVRSALLLDLFALMGLAFGSDPYFFVVCFALHSILVPVILFCLDILLESETEAQGDAIGNIRGIYLSIGMVSALLAPLFGGFLVGPDALYARVYLASGLFLIPALALLTRKYRMFVDTPYHVFSFRRTLSAVLKNKAVLQIGMAQFLLRFYFSWMVVYLPIYLHEVIGFSWPTIGTVLALMLIPYILFEWPAGLLADRVLGEKELLMVGFVLVALPTAFLPFLTTTNLFAWASILFITRIGTALIESMSETAFFKHVHREDTDLISYFRMLRPFAYIMGPLCATLLLIYIPLGQLWGVLGAVMLVGILTTYTLVDSR